MSAHKPTLRKILSLHTYLLPAIYYLLLTAACTPPTPPPSPTPWSSPTPVSVGTEAAPSPEAQLVSTPSPTETPDVTAVPETVSITIWENLSEAQAQLLAQDIGAFQAEFPQYQVALQHYDSPENFMTPLTAGQLDFDVVLASPVMLGNLQATEQIAPMADFFSRTFIDDFATVPLDSASRDGNIWGLPDSAGFHLLLYYNRSLVDTPPATTAELAELAQSLTQEEQWGLGVNSYDPLWITPWLTPYGSWLTDDTGNPTLDTPAMADALALHLGWHALPDGVAPIETYDEMRTRFLNGNIAIMIDGEWAIGELAQTSKVDWGVAPLPEVGDDQSRPAVPLVLARYWAISRNATGARAQASAAFLQFITRPERQLTWMTQFGLLPTQRAALDDPIIVNDPVWRVSANQMRAGRTVPLGVNVNLLIDAMRQPLQDAIDGKLTPQNAAKMMQANIEN